MSSQEPSLPFFIIRERGVFFLLSDTQKISLLKGKKSLGEQIFTQKKLVSIRKELFPGHFGRIGFKQNHELS